MNLSSVRAWVKRAGPFLALAALLAAAIPLLGKLEARTQSGFWEMPFPPMALGAIIGLVYGLLAVGVVLVYRTNRIVNFAHGETGAFAAAAFGLLVVRWHIPYWLALPLGLGIGGLVGAAAETAVIRRLRNAPKLMSVVATLGVGTLLVTFAVVMNSTAGVGAQYPEPSGLPTFKIGALLVSRSYLAMLILGPIAVAALVIFLRWSKYGLALRAAAAAPETARLAGVFAGRMSSLAWALAGALSAFTAILTQPAQGFSGAQTFGPSLLLRALAAAAVGRMSSLPGALAAGIGLGVIEQLLLWNFAEAGLVQVVLFGIILIALVIQRAKVGREDDDRGSWAVVQALRPIPDALRRVWAIRNLGTIFGALALGVALALPALGISNSAAVQWSGIFALSIVGLSLGIVTGLGGQLSLGQFAVAAIGGVISYQVTTHGGPFGLAFIYAGLGAALTSVLLGIPALRAKGLMLTVTTLAFALIAPAWLLGRPWMLGGSVNPSRPMPFGLDLTGGRSYYFFALALLVLVIMISRNVRRGGFGRVLVAVRDNEDNARAFTIRARLVKVQAFLLAGFMAGLGGALYAHSLSVVSPASYPTALSIDLVKMTVIGGLGIMAGPLLGALFVLALPAFVALDTLGLAATSLGQLIIIMYLPGGLAQLVEPVRYRLIRIIGTWAGIDVEAAFADADPTSERGVARTGVQIAELPFASKRTRPPGTLLLEARHLHKNFGGVRAVDGVSMRVHAGETIGLIGPNGAGKTTTFELLSGFVRADAGTVWFDGQDVTALGPEVRAKIGLIRSFQDSALFPTMTVTEAISIAFERANPTGFLSSVAGLSFKEKRKQAEAREVVTLMGLDPYRHRQIQELSTGTRRITEIACLVATRPTLLLFDEPSTGIAQRETEALGQVIRDIKDALGLTLVIIEHDMPLIMGLADRIIAMADGKIIASGPPDVVSKDPLVVEAYLGGSMTAIDRSGPSIRNDMVPAGGRS